MHAYTQPIPSKPIWWILVTDGGHLGIYECRHVEKIISLGGTGKHTYQSRKMEWELQPLPNMFRSAESVKDYQLGHDRRGSVFGSAASVRHTVEPHLDARDEVKHHLVRSIAATLQRASSEKRFTHLIVAAPAKMLGDLREHFGPSLMKLVAAELPKDLTRCPEHELLSHLKDVLPPTNKNETKELLS
jgi:protein required for attachment to host cells